MIKEGQIDILQKTLAAMLGEGSQTLAGHPSFQSYEAALIEKDKAIEALLAKVQELSRQLNRRGEELASIKKECVNLGHRN
jgi:hypothetical protein